MLSTNSGEMARKVLESAKSVSYWKSNRDRIMEQVVVQIDDRNVILPHLVCAGTLTRRAVEKTWLTASNTKEDRIGSELKTLGILRIQKRLARQIFK